MLVRVTIVAEDPVLAEIRELDFIGSLKYASNMQYAVAFADSCRTPTGMRGGYRESGPGTVILLRNSDVLWTTRIPRPICAAVSNNGDVLACDAGFGASPEGTMLIFGPTGTKRVTETINAKLFSCVVTYDGSFAAFNSCGSAVGSDSSKLFLYSVPSATRIFAAEFPIVRLDSLAATAGEISATAEGVTYRYSSKGFLLNQTEITRILFERAMASGNYVKAHFTLDKLKSSSSETADDFLFDGLTRLVSTDAPPEYRAKCLRRLGEMCLSDGQRHEAAERFRQALSLNPKIRLKRKLADLEKQISSG